MKNIIKKKKNIYIYIYLDILFLFILKKIYLIKNII